MYDISYTWENGKRMLAGKYMIYASITQPLWLGCWLSSNICNKVCNKIEIPLYEMNTNWAMYILGLRSSWGTLRICTSWSPSEHQLTPALSPFGACVWSHSVRRGLFIVLMTAAHISPNVFSLRMFLSNSNCFSWYTMIASTHIIHHIHTYNYIFYFVHLNHIFISSGFHGRLAALSSLCPIQFWSLEV